MPSPRRSPRTCAGRGDGEFVFSLWVLGLVFFSLFTGRIPAGRAGPGLRAGCLVRVCLRNVGEFIPAGPGRCLLPAGGRGAPWLRHRLASDSPRTQKKKNRTKNRSPRASCPAGVTALAKANFARLTMDGGSTGRGRNAGAAAGSWVSSAGEKRARSSLGGYAPLIPCLFSV